MDAQRVLARIRQEESQGGRRGAGGHQPILHWARQIAWPGAWAAAGFLFGLLILRSQENLDTYQTEMPEGPHMVLAQGQVFLGQDQQRRLLPVGAPIPDGSHIETSDQGTCVVYMRDGSVVLMDRNTRIRVNGSNEVDLENGRILARIRKGEADLIVTGKGSAATRLLQSDKEPWGESIFIKQGDKFEILSLQGLASVQSQSGARLRLGPRRYAVLIAGKESQNELLPYLSHRRAWAEQYLAFLPEPEWQIALKKDLPNLIEHLGDEKRWMEVDVKLRHMGTAAIDSLFSVVEKFKDSEDSGEIEKRLHAAGLVSNMAGLLEVDRLFHYLSDESPRVRTSMFFGLERLIGSYYSEESEKRGMIFSEGTKEERRQVIKKWKLWWDKK